HKHRLESQESEPLSDQTNVPKSPNRVRPSSSSYSSSYQPLSESGMGSWKKERNSWNEGSSWKDGILKNLKENGNSSSEYKTALNDLNSPEGGGGDGNGKSIPFFDVRSGKYYGNGKDLTPVVMRNGVLSDEQERHGTSQQLKEKSCAADATWGERKAWMDSALSWLRTELAGLRDMDNLLICQFRRCQDTIETLKTQRDVWEGLSEEGEECEYWDDYEINEFNKKYLDSPGGSSCSQLSPGSRNSSLYDVTSVSAPRLALPGESRGSRGQIVTGANSVTQDVEATV
ncbi:hypothetical protein EGW08_003947, partial [Elysia chlorotica]